MFGSLGVPELIFIFALALLIFGPRKLPEIGRTIGRGLSEFRKASTDLKRSINAEMIEEEMRQSDPRRIMNDEAPASSSDAGDDGAAGQEPLSAAGEKGGTAPEGSVPRSPSGEAPSEAAPGNDAPADSDAP